MVNLTKENYLVHLNDIKMKLEFFLEQVYQGNVSYATDIALKLRILFCRRSGTESLFKTIEDSYGITFQVIVRHSLAEKVKKGLMSESLLKGLEIVQINSASTWLQGGDELMPLLEAVSKKDEILRDSELYSYKEIFENVADKMGGAHIDKTVPDKILIPHSRDLLLGGFTMAELAIIETAKSAVSLIELFNKYINDGEENLFIKKISNKTVI